MDQLSNKKIVSLLLVALVVTVVGTLISVNQINGEDFGVLSGAAVTNTITPTLNQELSKNILHQKAPNKLIVLIKNEQPQEQEVVVKAQLFSEEGFILATESEPLQLAPRKTDQAELKLDLRNVELGEYILKLQTYYNQQETQQKEIKVYLIK